MEIAENVLLMLLTLYFPFESNEISNKLERKAIFIMHKRSEMITKFEKIKLLENSVQQMSDHQIKLVVGGTIRRIKAA